MGGSTLRDPWMGGLAPLATGYADGSQPDVRLYWETYGARDGRPCLVLNGALAKIPIMGPSLQEMTNMGYLALIYESRGLGRSSCPPGPQTTTQLAADALALVNAVWGPDCRFCVIGASLGGMVAQELLADLVAKGQASRVTGAILTVTAGGSWLRPPPFMRFWLMRAAMNTHTYTDQEDFDARYFDLNLNRIFSKSYLDGPAPPITTTTATAITADASSKTGTGTGKYPEAASGTGAGEGGGGGGGTPTRRDVIVQLLSGHWRRLVAVHRDEADRAAWQLCALASHYLAPHKAAAIKASGINILAGLASEDAVIPVQQQRQLAASLGARAEVLCAGHMDGCVLDGVSCMARLREQGLLPGL